jgi:two-component sensor histidine kinase
VFVHETCTRAVPQVRREVVAALGDWGLDDPDFLDAMCMIVTELAANAVVHAAALSPTFDVTLSLDDDFLVIEVGDRNPHRPTPRDAPHSTGHGYGLRFVADLAAACHGCAMVVPTSDGGKAVRVRVELPRRVA